MPATTQALLPVQVKERWLALEALAVQEIVGQRPWVPIPGAPPHIPGVMAWRGRAIAVLDLGAITETADPLKPGEERPRAVVIQLGTTTIAIPVEAAREVREVAAERLRNPHATRQRYALHEVDLDGVPTPVVDLSGILSSFAQEGPSAS